MRTWSLFMVVLLLNGCQLSESPGTASDKSLNNTVNTKWGTYPYAQAVSFSDVLVLDANDASATLHYGNDPLQYGQLWLPEKTVSTPPLVIFVHGGCWLSAYDIQHSYAMASALAKAGFAVWSIEYRRAGDEGGGWPGSLNDVVRAIEFIFDQTQYDFNREQISLSGHSAGGHLAMLAAQKSDVPLKQTIGLAPIIDIEKYARGSNSCQRATSEFMHGMPDDRPAQYEQASLVNARFQHDVVIMTSDKDTIVPMSANPLPEATFISVNNAGHFDWLHPGTPAFAEFIKQLQY